MNFDEYVAAARERADQSLPELSEEHECAVDDFLQHVSEVGWPADFNGFSKKRIFSWINRKQ